MILTADTHGGIKMEYVKLETKTGDTICLEILPSQQESGREQQVASRSKNKDIPTYQAESFFRTVTGFAHDISEKLSLALVLTWTREKYYQ